LSFRATILLLASHRGDSNSGKRRRATHQQQWSQSIAIQSSILNIASREVDFREALQIAPGDKCAGSFAIGETVRSTARARSRDHHWRHKTGSFAIGETVRSTARAGSRDHHRRLKTHTRPL